MGHLHMHQRFVAGTFEDAAGNVPIIQHIVQSTGDFLKSDRLLHKCCRTNGNGVDGIIFMRCHIYNVKILMSQYVSQVRAQCQSVRAPFPYSIAVREKSGDVVFTGKVNVHKNNVIAFAIQIGVVQRAAVGVNVRCIHVHVFFVYCIAKGILESADRHTVHRLQ